MGFDQIQRINPGKRPFRIAEIKPVTPVKQNAATSQTAKSDFARILSEIREREQIKFSNHALLRLSQRNIRLNPSDLNKLKTAIDMAQQKGARDSLVLMETQDRKTVAFVVNIPNKTVITAIDKEAAKEHTFTNIDTALIV